MIMTAALLLAAFSVLVPQDAAQLKIGMIEDSAKAFAAFSEGFDGVAAEEVPSPNLLLTWRKLGIPVYAKVAFDAEGSAEFFRKRCGILPYAAGADGVILDTDIKRLPPGWQAALAAAKEDVRLSERLQSLANKCRASKDAQIVLEGRRIGNWFGEQPFIRDNVDTIRLETVGLIRHLEKILGEQPCEVVESIAKTEPNTIAFTPFQGGNFTKIRSEGLGKPLTLGPGVTLTVSAGEVFIRFSDPSVPFDVRGLPCGRDTFRFKLYLPERRGTGWERHDIVLTAPQKPMPRVDASCLEGMAINIEERFGSGTHRVYEIPSRTWSEDYQMLHFAKGRPYSYARTGKDNRSVGWKIDARFPMSDIVGQWPVSETPRFNLWYVSVDRFADGSKGGCFRIQFPKGNAKTHADMCAALDCVATTDVWKNDSGELQWAWRDAELERLRPAPETGVAHRYSRAENNLFWRNVIEPIFRRGAKSFETALADMEHENPKFRTLLVASQRSFVAASEPYRHIYEISSRLRRDFLLMRAKGETPPEPRADALGEEEDRLKKPASLSVDEDGAISLDEETL